MLEVSKGLVILGYKLLLCLLGLLENATKRPQPSFRLALAAQND